MRYGCLLNAPLCNKGQHQRERNDTEQGRDHDSGGCEPDVAVELRKHRKSNQ